MVLADIVKRINEGPFEKESAEDAFKKPDSKVRFSFTITVFVDNVVKW